MRTIDTRKVAVLKIIVENYLQTGDIIGSKALLRSYDLQVSSATVRNDMAALEKMGLVFQPYNSAGRLPTPRGIRVFVDYLMEHSPAMLLESGALSEENGIPARNHLDDTLYDVVSRLARISREIAFISLPHEGVYLVSGLAGFIERSLPDGVTAACTVVRLVEDRPTFRALLSQLPLMPNKVWVFIGEEIPLPGMETSTLMVKPFTIGNKIGQLGIVGPLKMDYAFNLAALKQVL